MTKGREGGTAHDELMRLMLLLMMMILQTIKTNNINSIHGKVNTRCYSVILSPPSICLLFSNFLLNQTFNTGMRYMQG